MSRQMQREMWETVGIYFSLSQELVLIDLEVSLGNYVDSVLGAEGQVASSRSPYGEVKSHVEGEYAYR